MGNTVAINAAGLSPYAFSPLPGGKSAFTRVVELAAGLPDAERILLLGAERIPASDRPVQAVGAAGRTLPIAGIDRPAWTIRALIEVLNQECGTSECDLFYLFGDQPLYDLSLAERMYQNHRRYFAEYSFADGYPVGLSPEILKTSLLRELPRLVRAEDDAILRDTLFTLIQRDINAFDIETSISPKDLRMLRVQLVCDTRRNWQLTTRVMEAGGLDEASVLAVVSGRGALLRTLPAYVEIQVEEGVTQEVSYSPYPKVVPDAMTRRGEMPLGKFKHIVEQVSRFSEDAIVSLSLWGEPALHSNLTELLAELYSHEGLSALIETSGVGWPEGRLEEISRRVGNHGMWIVDLDAASPELYKRLRGDGWAEALATTEQLLSLFPGKVYVQAVRMTTNEAELEEFYRTWKDRVPNVIIQKYDSFAGYLPELRVTDVSPLKRFACWHLKRDLCVLLDGSVPMCREDLSREHLLGNLFEEELPAIWARGSAVHERHVAEDYPDICKACDEYYTYNF